MKKYLPNYHGGWAMIFLPIILHYCQNPNSKTIITTLAINAAYFLFFALTNYLKTKKTQYKNPVIIYFLLTFLFSILCLIKSPKLFSYLIFSPIVIICLIYAKQRKERATLSGIAAVILSGLILPLLSSSLNNLYFWELDFIIYQQSWISLSYFMGTVFYVKTMIRERKNPKFWYFSLAYHLIILLINHKFYLFFSLILFRAFLLPYLSKQGRKFTNKFIGIGEFILSFLLLFLLITNSKI